MIEVPTVRDVQATRDNLNAFTDDLAKVRMHLAKQRPRWMTTADVETLLKETCEVLRRYEELNCGLVGLLDDLLGCVREVNRPEDPIADPDELRAAAGI